MESIRGYFFVVRLKWLPKTSSKFSPENWWQKEVTIPDTQYVYTVYAIFTYIYQPNVYR